MYKMYDFYCAACEKRFEALVGKDETPACACGSKDVTLSPNSAAMFTVTAVLKKNKAGHVHRFQNRPREKIGVQVPAKISR